MSDSKLVMAALKSTPHLAILSFTLLSTYLTLDWKVRKARRAFEKQLIDQGISKEEAKQISQFLEDFKANITSIFTQSMTTSGF